MLPMPAYSHIYQQLQFARQLVRQHGFKMTIINSTHYHNLLMKSQAEDEVEARLNRGIEFLHVSDGLADDHPRVTGVLMVYVAAVCSMQPAIDKLILELHSNAPITCLIRDLHLPFGPKAARDACIPVANFAANGVLYDLLGRYIEPLIEKGYLPDAAKAKGQKYLQIDWERPITDIPGVPLQLRVKDLPFWPSVKTKLHATAVDCIEKNSTEEYVNSDWLLFVEWKRAITPKPSMPHQHKVEDSPFWSTIKGNLHPTVVESIEKNIQYHSDSDWLLFNSVYELESDTIDAMRELTPNVCSIGPLSLADYSGEETRIDWLNQQEPQSVVVLAFGTTTSKSIQQWKEVAHGLEASQRNFLWVFSPEQQVHDKTDINLEDFRNFMSTFAERTQHRGHITKWASRFFATLRHPAVGAFATHCGWNSVLEGIASGIPMLSWPSQRDHFTIARCMTAVWEVALPLEGDGEEELVTRDEIELKVRRILAKKGEDPEIDALRARAMDLKRVVEKAITKDDSSLQSLASFVEDMRKNAK